MWAHPPALETVHHPGALVGRILNTKGSTVGGFGPLELAVDGHDRLLELLALENRVAAGAGELGGHVGGADGEDVELVDVGEVGFDIELVHAGGNTEGENVGDGRDLGTIADEFEDCGGEVELLQAFADDRHGCVCMCVLWSWVVGSLSVS